MYVLPANNGIVSIKLCPCAFITITNYHMYSTTMLLSLKTIFLMAIVCIHTYVTLCVCVGRHCPCGCVKLIQCQCHETSNQVRARTQQEINETSNTHTAILTHMHVQIWNILYVNTYREWISIEYVWRMIHKEA